MKYGIRSVTMDDIAREIGISKKTLYQYCPNKKALVNQALQTHFAEERRAFKEMLKPHDNAIDEMLKVFQYNRQFIKDFNLSVIYDLKKYYPGSWKIFEDYKNEYIYNVILNNIKKGVKEGYYRQSLDPDIIAKLYVHRVEIIIDKEVFPESNFNSMDVYREFVEYHLRGIATSKGIKYIEANQKNLI